MKYEIFETRERVLADNDAQAAKIRTLLNDKAVFFVNLMASPGAGKTTTLKGIINELKDRYRIGVIECDIDSSVDAQAISELGIDTIQLHTGTICHMDADMTLRGLEKFGYEKYDVIFLENIGNLVCPAEFDIGEHLKMMILSVPEGDDKPLKYPLMFTVSDCLLINKIDTKEIFDFNEEACRERALALNPDIKIFPICAKDHIGFKPLADYLIDQIENWRKSL